MIDNAATTFTPIGNSVTIAGTTTSASAALPIAAADGVRPQVRIAHGISGTIAFVAFGNASVAATVANSIPVFPNYPEVFTVPNGATHFAAILSTGTGSVFATSGFGAK